MIYFDLLIQGIIQGSIYALIAVGLTLVYGLLRVLHIAHAGLFTLGAYIGVITMNYSGSLFLSFIISMIVVGILGVGIYRFCYKPLLSKPPYIALIASIGLFISMEEIYRMVFGSQGISFNNVPLSNVFVFGSIHIKSAEIFVIILTVLLVGLLSVFTTKTRIGIGWRATVTQPEMAKSFGINVENVRYGNFFMGSALAAAGGVMVAILNNLVEPTMGGVPSYKALAIIVLGGLGNVKGTLIASILLGLIEAFGTIYLGNLLDRDAIAFAFLIIVLMLKPQGLFGMRS
jgi:branched-chain amino acid transport system permease protein